MELVLAALLFTTLLMSVAIIVTKILDELRRRKRAIGLRWISFMFGFSYLTAPHPTPPRVPTKAELERDARKHWDEQVRALGGVEDELFFYPPSDYLYANKIVTKYLDGGCMDYYELRHTNLQRPGFDDSVVL